jgi:hypothetical protein
LPVEAVERETLSDAGGLPVGRVRQISRLDVTGQRAVVTFEAVDADALFAGLVDEGNAARVTTADGRVFTTTGRGAGRVPTGESVWADLTDLLRGGGRAEGRAGHVGEFRRRPGRSAGLPAALSRQEGAAGLGPAARG